MRMLVIGYPLPSPSIDNYNPLTAPSYNDYDALFVDPASVTKAGADLLAGGAEFEAYDGRPVLNLPTSAASVSAADQLKRRAAETERLLAAGGAVIVIARPNATLAGIGGFEGCDRYSWLPAPAGMAWDSPFLVAAEGSTVRVTDEAHPLGRVLRTYRGEARYRAYFDDRQAAVRRHAQVIATGGAGVPVAVEFAVGGGRVLFIPAMADAFGNTRSEMAEAFVEAALALLGAGSSEVPPPWASDVQIAGLDEAEAGFRAAQAAVLDAASAEAEARTRRDSLAVYRRLLWCEGVTLGEAAAAAFRLLGFTVTGGPAALAIEDEGRTAFVECEGSREQVVEWPYIRLQRRLEKRLLDRGEQSAGLVVANGLRREPPLDRGEQFAPTLRIACENYRYALITGDTLLALARSVLEGASEAAKAGMRRRLLGTSGHVDREAALGHGTQEEADGPIF